MRLCWSEIGCPSTLNEVSACSPSGWNTLFESAATPGVASVSIELSAAFTLSLGRFWMSPERGTRPARARGYNRLKALFMAAEALVQAWLSDLARRAALKGSGWMGPS
jgi:hypothetical protein